MPKLTSFCGKYNKTGREEGIDYLKGRDIAFLALPFLRTATVLKSSYTVLRLQKKKKQILQSIIAR